MCHHIKMLLFFLLCPYMVFENNFMMDADFSALRFFYLKKKINE